MCFFYVQIIDNNLKQDYVEKHNALYGNKIKKNLFEYKGQGHSHERWVIWKG